MSNLTPTPIVDKNGKATTVHKKPEGSSTGAARVGAVAAPRASSQAVTQPREKLVRRTFQTRNSNVSEYARGDRLEDFEMNPPYQRGSVWDVDRKRNLIKSLITGNPIGAIILNKRGENSEKFFAVVDGKQRIEALAGFANDEYGVDAGWFDAEVEESEVEDGREVVYYSGLSKKGQRQFGNLPVPTLEAEVATIEEEADLFTLVNTTGVEQTEADLANARNVSAR